MELATKTKIAETRIGIPSDNTETIEPPFTPQFWSLLPVGAAPPAHRA
jgi:hypothetical protein